MRNDQSSTLQPAPGTTTAANSSPDFNLLDNDDLAVAPPKRRRWPAVIVILLVIGGVAYFWLQRGKKAPAPVYNTVEAGIGDITQAVTANGQITPVKTVQVGSQVSGIITELMADYNSTVTNGQIVAQIDPSSYQQSLVQAEAELANAQAVLWLAKVNYDRARALRDGAANTQAELDAAEASLRQAEATVKSREAAVNRAKVDLEKTTIYSPIDGIVISRAVDVGQTVAASLNAPTLFTIAKDLREMQIEAAVSEADVGGVQEGQRVDFTVDAFPNITFQGQVSQLRYEPKTNQNVVSYTTVVDLRNEDLKLRPGMTANASIIIAERQGVLRVPNAALRFKPETRPDSTDSKPAPPAGSQRGPGAGGREPGSSPGGKRNAPKDGSQMRTVYVLESTGGKEPALKTVQIKTGISNGAWTEVLDGLKPGDVVVTGVRQTQPATAAAPPGGSPFGGGMRGPRTR